MEIHSGRIIEFINTKYPNVVIGIVVGGDGSIQVNHWADSATDDQKSQVQALIGNLDIALIEATWVYNQNYAAFDARTLELEAEGFTYLGGIFHADDKGIRNIQSMMMASGYLAYPMSLYDKSSTWTFNSASDVIAMGSAVMAFVTSVETAAKPLRDAIAQQSGESSIDWFNRMQNWKESR